MQIVKNVPELLSRIEICIVKSGMGKEEFYKKSGVSSASFSQWNLGRHAPSVRAVQRMADALGVSAEYLLAGDADDQTPPTLNEQGARKLVIERTSDMTDEELEAVAKYIDFIKSQRP